MSSASVPLGYLVSRYPAISHTFILREIAHLRSMGFSIRTASINPPDRALESMDPVERAEAEQTYCIKKHGALGALMALAYWLVVSPLQWVRTWRESWRFGFWKGTAYTVEAAMVARWMAGHSLKHLHVHFGNVGASVGALVKQLNGCHLSYTIHGPDEFDDVPGQQLAYKMHVADKVVCISQFARSQLMRICAPDDWPKFTVCRLGVDATVFNGTLRTEVSPITRLVSIGRLTPAKGQVLLIQACAKLVAQDVPFHLHMIGDGPDRARVEAEIDKLDLRKYVTLHGAQTQDWVRKELAQSDVFVLPSFAEGIPVVLMEAMSSYVPCISSPVNGIPELIEHGRTGLLATPGDVDSLVQQLATLCAQPEKRRQMALEAYEKVTMHFDLLTNVRALGEIFKQFPKI